jgi:ABC-2 type transport system permease protein
VPRWQYSSTGPIHRRQHGLSTAHPGGPGHANRVLLQTLKARGIAGLASAPLDVRTRVLYNPDMQSSYNMVPGLIALILMMTTSMLTSLSIVKEREQGTIEQLIVTPIRSWELVVAKITPYAVVSIINVIFILMLGTLWFHVPIRGSFLLLFSLTGLFLLPNLGIGLLISSIARTQQQAQFMVMPIMLPSMMLSDSSFPSPPCRPSCVWSATFCPSHTFWSSPAAWSSRARPSAT